MHRSPVARLVKTQVQRLLTLQYSLAVFLFELLFFKQGHFALNSAVIQGIRDSVFQVPEHSAQIDHATNAEPEG